MKTKLVLLNLLFAASALAGPHDGALYYRWQECGIAYTSEVRFTILNSKAEGLKLWWEEACAAPTLSAITNAAYDAEAVAWVAGQMESNAPPALVANTNTIKSIRAEVRTSRTNSNANKATMQATTALTNGYTASEARQLINDIRRELIDTISEQQAQTRAMLDMLKAQ